MMVQLLHWVSVVRWKSKRELSGLKLSAKNSEDYFKRLEVDYNISYRPAFFNFATMVFWNGEIFTGPKYPMQWKMFSNIFNLYSEAVQSKMSPNIAIYPLDKQNCPQLSVTNIKCEGKIREILFCHYCYDR